MIGYLTPIAIIIGGLIAGLITFLLVSLLMAIANHKIRKQTNSSALITITSILGLSIGGVLILYYEFTNEWEEMLFIIGLYVVLAIGA